MLQRNENPVTQAQAIKMAAAKPLQSTTPTYEAGVKSYTLPFPGAPHDGGPQDVANTQAITKQQSIANNVQYAIDNKPGLIDKLALGLNVGLATAGLGAGMGLTAGGLGGGTSGMVAAGAANGALGGALNSALSGGNVLKKVGIGGVLGGVGGGLNAISSPANNALTNAGMNPTLAAGLIKGAVGAGTGALGGALSGNGIGNGALVGGLAGAANGALGQASGNPGLGQVGGTIAGTLANKYLTSPNGASKTPTAPPPGGTPSGVIPPLPGQGAQNNNLGSYSGYGYAPRQQAANPVSDYSTYGQGPEAQFYQNTGSGPTSSTMSTPQLTGITKQNGV